jgi:hypothetical protein
VFHRPEYQWKRHRSEDLRAPGSAVGAEQGIGAGNCARLELVHARRIGELGE